MDSEDRAFMRSFCLFALAVFVVLCAIIMYFHSNAEPVTPSTSSRTTHAVASENDTGVELVDSTTLQQQEVTSAKASATSSSTNSGDSDDGGLGTFFLIVCMLGGVMAYMIRGGKPFFMKQRWQTF